MTLRSWVRNLFRPKAHLRKRPRSRLSLEALEDRLAPAVFTVNTLADTVDADPAVTSLREALTAANGQAGADVINFDASFSTPRTIRLLGELPAIAGDLTINGPAAARLTISGDANNSGTNDRGDVRVLSVSAGSVTLSNLTLANGRAQGADGTSGLQGMGGAAFGGGIFVGGGTVTLNNVTVSGNVAEGGRGGLEGDIGAEPGGTVLAEASTSPPEAVSR